MADYDYADAPWGAIWFTGTWREFLPIAATNLALTIATLGLYRFWAKARERRYLWSRTTLIDDALEWTGTGKEMLVGFLIVTALVVPMLLFLQFGVQALVVRGQFIPAVAATFAIYVFLYYLVSVGRFRALRYRLSRTYWHGIRGGSDDKGWRYGGSALLKGTVTGLTAWLLTPWMMTSLWNERWRTMSFGPHRFGAEARARPLFGRFMLFYLSPLLLGLVAFAMVGTRGGMIGDVYVYSEFPLAIRLAMLAVITLGVFILLGLAALTYYSVFLTEAIGSLSLDGLQFSFDATIDDWVHLFLLDVAIVVGTLGLGFMFLSYRHWSFFIGHLEIAGALDLAEMTQSRTRGAAGAEGLASAFDIGAL